MRELKCGDTDQSQVYRAIPAKAKTELPSALLRRVAPKTLEHSYTAHNRPEPLPSLLSWQTFLCACEKRRLRDTCTSRLRGHQRCGVYARRVVTQAITTLSVTLVCSPPPQLLHKSEFVTVDVDVMYMRFHPSTVIHTFSLCRSQGLDVFAFTNECQPAQAVYAGQLCGTAPRRRSRYGSR